MGLTYIVADSALYSEANLQKLAQTAMKWITRVPATLSEAQAALAQVDPQALASLQEGYRYHELTSTYGGDCATLGTHLLRAPPASSTAHHRQAATSSRVMRMSKP